MREIVAGKIPPGEELHEAQVSFAIDRWRIRCFGYPEELANLSPLDPEPARALPDRMGLWYVFRRTASPADEPRIRRELEAAASQVSDLDAFRKLARETSEGGNAHLGGRMGLVVEGQLPARLFERLAAVPVGAVSPVLENKAGLFLFFVESRESGRLSDPAQDLRRRERRRELEVVARCRARRLEEVSAMPAELTGEERAAAENLALARLWSLGGHSRPEEALRFHEIGLEARMVEEVSARASRRIDEPTEDELRREFELTVPPLKRPKHLGLTLVTLSVTPDADAFEELNRLAEARTRLVLGEDEETVAASLDGAELRRLPPTALRNLAGLLGPPIFEGVRVLEPGEWSAPLADRALYVLARIDTVEPPRPQTFEEARPILEKKLARRGEDAARLAVIDELLRGHDFRWTDAAVALFQHGSAGPPRSHDRRGGL